ncbi:hypothetical protein SDC9_125929 [bioreactor metagenome]|uniref:Uncharacterized protein n=1 Tax=bioreactor metagenome TaxID=1076179 RepID=A0A645CPW6_9ZZZZ
MVIVRGADEPVVGDVHQLPQILHAPWSFHDAVHKLLGGNTGLLGLRLNFLAVLVRAGEEHHVEAVKPLIAGDGVGCDSAVGVADVQLVRGVVNGRCDIKLLFFHGISPPFPSPE